MNANAYGGELARVLEWVDVCTADGRRAPQPGPARLRVPALEPEPGRGRLARVVRCSPADPAAVKATLAEMRGKRREAQPSGIKTFGSTFKNPRTTRRAEGRTAGQLLEAAGCPGPRGRAARGSRPSTRTSSRTPARRRTADVLAVMADGRRRVHERFGVDARARGAGPGRGRLARDWELDGRRRRSRRGPAVCDEPIAGRDPAERRATRAGSRDASRSVAPRARQADGGQAPTARPSAPRSRRRARTVPAASAVRCAPARGRSRLGVVLGGRRPRRDRRGRLLLLASRLVAGGGHRRRGRRRDQRRSRGDRRASSPQARSR